MSRVERVAAHAGQIHALLQRIINECDAAQTEVFDYLNMSDAVNKQYEKLKAENTKLRQITKRMWPFAKAYLELMPTLGLNDSESYDIEMALRELGIEVSE